MRRRSARVVLALALGAAFVGMTARPTYASDGGAIAAGILGGTALGVLAAGAAGAFDGPPPPPYGAPLPPDGYERVEDGPPPRCHRVMVRRWDDDVGDYVVVPRRVCDGY